MNATAPKVNDQPGAISAAELKRQAEGRWLQILAAAGLPIELLDGRGHPCPKCGGTDRFSVFGDVDLTGGLMCRQCFNKGNGDGFAAVMWLRDCSFPEALAFVAETLGIRPASGSAQTPNVPLCIVEAVARAKKMPLDTFLQFGAISAKRGKLLVARVPVYDERGEVHSHFDLTPDDKGWFRRGKGSSGMFFPGRLPQAAETWLLVEGVKDAAALVGLGFNAAGLPRNEMAPKYARLFADCDVIVVPDLDVPGTDGAQRTAGRLAGVASSVKIARLPGEVVQSGGQDVRDVISREGDAAVRLAVEAALPWEPSEGGPDDERPEVFLTLAEAVVADVVVRALGKLGVETQWLGPDESERAMIYQRGGVLVHVVCDAKPPVAGVTLPEAVPQIRALPKAICRERITQAVRLMEEKTKGDDVVIVAVRPPDWLVQGVHQRGDYGSAVRMLAGITRTPMLRRDGTVIQQAGYDDRTGLLYRPDRTFPAVQENPTQDDAARAASELLEVMADFPFESDGHQSIWLACVLTLLARPAIDGPCPLFVFDANTRGAGKSLLADVAGIIAHGNPMARKTWPNADEEVRKTITSVALEAWPAILLDNVATTLGGPSLDAALTGTTWQDRILGESRTTGLLPLTTVWIATGNNVELSADTARRTLLSRLESLEEHPEDRTEFRHPDLKYWVRENRARLAVAGLTVLRAYFAAGCPDGGLTPWGSFEDWSKLIRGAIVFAGQADPWQTRETVRDADRSAEMVRLLHAGIEEADVHSEGLTTAEIVQLLSHRVDQDDVDSWPVLRTAITELCGAKIDSRKLGYGLRRYRGRVCAGKRLESRAGHGGVKRWFVESIGERVVTASAAQSDAVPESTTTADVSADCGDEVEVF